MPRYSTDGYSIYHGQRRLGTGDTHALADELVRKLNAFSGLLRTCGGLVWSVAGEQEDPIELARALGPEAPQAIRNARDAIAAAHGVEER